MSDQDQTPLPSVPAEAYTKDYYESTCDGYLEFQETLGEKLPMRLQIPLKLANLKPGEISVDIGCGRGEILLHSVLAGGRAWGLDYAPEALKLAQQAIARNLKTELKQHVGLQRSSATELPLADHSVDLVFMLDVVEHLYPHELKRALIEAWRVLRPGGRLIIHTMPNLWYYKFGYPLFRVVQRLRGKILPADPRARGIYPHVHVNEQTPTKLTASLREARFKAKVWLYSIHDYQEESNRLVRWGMIFLTRVYPFRWIFCDDIFALAYKPLSTSSK